MREENIKRMLKDKFIAIIRGMEEEKIVPLAEALYNGGFRCIEVTFNLREPDNHAQTARSIEAIAKRFGNEVLTGAGTVVAPELVDIAADAGALYIVSPNTDVDVIRRTRERELVSVPGALSATECMIAHNAGADFIKLFPTGSMGTGYLKSLIAPLSHLRFVATGGIDENNFRDYLKAGAVCIGVGGNLINKEWIAAGEFNKITDLAKLYTELS